MENEKSNPPQKVKGQTDDGGGCEETADKDETSPSGSSTSDSSLKLKIRRLPGSTFKVVVPTVDSSSQASYQKDCGCQTHRPPQFPPSMNHVGINTSPEIMVIDLVDDDDEVESDDVEIEEEEIEEIDDEQDKDVDPVNHNEDCELQVIYEERNALAETNSWNSPNFRPMLNRDARRHPLVSSTTQQQHSTGIPQARIPAQRQPVFSQVQQSLRSPHRCLLSRQPINTERRHLYNHRPTIPPYARPMNHPENSEVSSTTDSGYSSSEFNEDHVHYALASTMNLHHGHYLANGPPPISPLLEYPPASQAPNNSLYIGPQGHRFLPNPSWYSAIYPPQYIQRQNLMMPPPIGRSTNSCFNQCGLHHSGTCQADSHCSH